MLPLRDCLTKGKSIILSSVEHPSGHFWWDFYLLFSS